VAAGEQAQAVAAAHGGDEVELFVSGDEQVLGWGGVGGMREGVMEGVREGVREGVCAIVGECEYAEERVSESA
jgi:hypothetical protein